MTKGLENCYKCSGVFAMLITRIFYHMVQTAVGPFEVLYIVKALRLFRWILWGWCSLSLLSGCDFLLRANEWGSLIFQKLKDVYLGVGLF